MLAAVAALVVMTSAAAAVWYAIGRGTSMPPLRLDIATRPTTDAMSMALSPDGRQIAYVATSGTGPKLWVRALEEGTARELKGTEDASYPFWSPDSRSLGFFALGKLQRIDLAGGAPTALADAPVGRGGTWNSAGVIVFAPSTNTSLLRIDANGGTPSEVTQLGERQTNHRWPQFLPDGNRFLFSVGVNGEEINGLYVGALDARATPRVLPTTTAAVFAAPDRLLYVAQGTLMARQFDPSSATVAGEPVAVAPNVGFDTALFRSAFTVSDNGVLAHRPAGPQRRQLTWFGRDGSKLGTAGPIDESAMTQPELSIDDRRVVIQRNVDSNSDIWVVDVDRSVTSRLTFTPQNETAPVWSPDGERILYRATSPRGGTQTFEKAANGTAQRVLFATPDRHTPNDWSRDGKLILFTLIDTKSHGDIWVLPTGDVRQAQPFLRTSFDEAAPRFSPDTRWIAYESNETGRYEIYVRPYPAGEAKWQLSNEGGRQPLWSRDGKELFYVSLDNQIVAVSVTNAPGGLTFAAPKPLFPIQMASGTNIVLTGGFQRAQYAVTGDNRFLVNLSVDDETPPIAVVVNWRAVVER
jgi:Tol biopolymer transport system component